MSKPTTTRYDVAEHLRTPEELAAYLEACLEEAEGDSAFIAKALGEIVRAKKNKRSDPLLSTEVFQTIQNGKLPTAMSAFKGKLSDQQIHDVVAYIRSLGR